MSRVTGGTHAWFMPNTTVLNVFVERVYWQRNMSDLSLTNEIHNVGIFYKFCFICFFGGRSITVLVSHIPTIAATSNVVFVCNHASYDTLLHLLKRNHYLLTNGRFSNYCTVVWFLQHRTLISYSAVRITLQNQYATQALYASSGVYCMGILSSPSWRFTRRETLWACYNANTLGNNDNLLTIGDTIAWNTYFTVTRERSATSRGSGRQLMCVLWGRCTDTLLVEVVVYRLTRQFSCRPAYPWIYLPCIIPKCEPEG